MVWLRRTFALGLGVVGGCSFASVGPGADGGDDSADDASTSAGDDAIDDAPGDPDGPPGDDGDDGDGDDGDDGDDDGIATATDGGDDDPPLTDDGGSSGDGASASTGDDDEGSSGGRGSSEGEAEAGSSGEPAAWVTKRRIDFDAATQALDLTDVPVVVYLDATRIEYEAVQDGGADLRFFDSTETVELAHEIDVWNPDGVSIVWVALPAIDDAEGSHFWMYYDNPDAPPGDDPEGVWAGPGGFVGVWHLDEDPAAPQPQFVDATGNGHDASASGSSAPTLGPSDLGPALTFDGDDLLQAPYDPAFDLSDAYTLEGVVQLSAAPTDMFRSLIRRDLTFTINVLNEFTDNLRIAQWQGGAVNFADTDDPLSLGVLHHVASTWDVATGTARLYVDGTLVIDDDFGADGPLDVTGGPLLIGRWVPGIVAEVRVSAVARPPGYFIVQTGAMLDAILSFGAAEPV